VGNGESAAGTEVVLHVDDDQRLLGIAGHASMLH
jgi:hypothetical protein